MCIRVIKRKNHQIRLSALALLTLCGISFDTRTSFSQEMVTIEKYLGQNDFKRNPGAMDFVFLRCASIFKLVGGALQENQDRSLHPMGKIYWESGDQFLSMASASKGFNQQFALDQFNRMLEAYKERWLRAKALSGNFSDDPVIRSDMQLCSAMMK
jgi:hypothetical protein